MSRNIADVETIEMKDMPARPARLLECVYA
jgi:hypothetical protein